MIKEHIGAPCPECGEPVELIFNMPETATYEISHEGSTCRVSSKDFKSWAEFIKTGGKKHLESTTAFIKRALADYSKRAGEILDKPRSENDGALLLKMRRKWLSETLLEFGNLCISNTNSPFINQAFDWMGIAIDLQQKLKAAMEKITALENENKLLNTEPVVDLLGVVSTVDKFKAQAKHYRALYHEVAKENTELKAELDELKAENDFQKIELPSITAEKDILRFNMMTYFKAYKQQLDLNRQLTAEIERLERAHQ